MAENKISKMMKAGIAVLVLFFAASGLGKEGKSCHSDGDCVKGHFCYDRSNVCAKCLNCTYYLRLPGERPCAKEPAHCGPCLPGYTHVQLSNNEVKDSCRVSDTPPPTTHSPEIFTHWGYIICASVAGVFILGIILFVYMVKKPNCIPKTIGRIKGTFRDGPAARSEDRANEPGPIFGADPLPPGPSAPLLYPQPVKTLHPEVFKETERLSQSERNRFPVEQLPPLPSHEPPPSYSENGVREGFAPGSSSSLFVPQSSPISPSLFSQTTAYPESTSTARFDDQESVSSNRSRVDRQSSEDRRSSSSRRQQNEASDVMQPLLSGPVTLNFIMNNKVDVSASCMSDNMNVANAQQGQKIGGGEKK